MPTISQDAELVIRARDLSSQPIAEVTQKVEQFTAALDAQARVAERGEGSIKDLNAAFGNAREAVAALLAQKGALDQFGTTVEKLAQAQAAQAAAGDRKVAAQGDADAARAALDAYRDSLEGVKKRTDEQRAKLAELKDAQAAANKALRDASADYGSAEKAAERLYGTYERQGQALGKLGVDIADVAKADKLLTEGLDAAQAAISRGAEALGSFNVAKQRANTLAEQGLQFDRAHAEATRINADLDAAAAAKAEQFDQAHYEAVRANARFDEQAAEKRKALADKARQDAEELARFQGVSAKALANAPALSPAGQAQTGPQVTATADALAAILAPAAAARQTLEGVEAEVAKVAGVLTNAKAKSQDFAEALRTLGLAGTQLANQAGLVDSYQRQEQAVAAAKAAYDKAHASLSALDAQARASVAPNRDLEVAIRAGVSELKQAEVAYERENVALTKLGGSLKAAKVDHANLASESKRLAAAASEAARVTTEATDKLAESVKRGGGATNTVFLNLRPDQISNLGHELAHAFDQVAAGGSVGQALTEQAGKAIFNFQNSFRALVPYLGYVAAGLAVVTVAVSAFLHAVEAIEATRNFEARLRSTADATITTGAALTAQVRTIQHFGASFEEANKAVQIFLAEGVNPARIVDFGRAAQDMSDVLGIKLPEAAKKLADAFGSGFDAVLKLQEETHAYTAEVLEEIRTLFDEGHAHEARTLAFNSYQKTIREGAAEAKGPLALAFRELRNAWDGLLEAFANSGPIRVAVSGLAALARGARDLINTLSFNGTNLYEGENGRKVLAGIDAQIKQRQEQVDALASSGGDPTGKIAGRLNASLDALRAQRAEVEKLSGAQAANAAAAQHQAEVQAANTEREKNANNEFVRERQEADNRRENESARGERAEEIRRRRIAQARIDATREAEKKGANPQDPAVAAEIEKTVDEVRKKIEDQRRQQVTAADELASLALKTAEASGRGLKGEEAVAAQRVVRERKVQDEITKLAKADGLDRVEAEKKYANQISAYRTGLEAEDARKIAKEREAAGEKSLRAEEGLEAQLLALRAKVDEQDKTNLDARLRAIDEQFGKIDILIARAQRAGVTSVGGQSLAEYKAQADAQKELLKGQETLKVYEAQLNALLAQRKDAYAAINEQAIAGLISPAEAFRRASEVASGLDPKIAELGRKAGDFARKLGGADPTPAVAKAITLFDKAAVNAPPKLGAKATEGVEGAANAEIERANLLLRERNEIIKTQRLLQSTGAQDAQTTEDKIREAYEKTTPQIQAVVDATQAQIDAALKLGAIAPDAYDRIRASLGEVRGQTSYASDDSRKLIATFESSVVNHALAGFDSVAQKIGQFAAGTGKLRDVFASVGAAFSSFAAGVLRDLGLMILKQLIFKAISAGLQAAGVPAGLLGVVGGAAGGGSAPSAHEGGVVGSLNTSRPVDPAWFRNAPRFHSGAVVGLQPDEQAAILQTGEEVLKRTDARNVLNGGLAKKQDAPAQRPVRQVLVFDPSQVSQALAGSHGEDVVLTHIRNNAGTVRQLVS